LLLLQKIEERLNELIMGGMVTGFNFYGRFDLIKKIYKVDIIKHCKCIYILTKDVAVVIVVPPAPPDMNTTLPKASCTIVGDMDDIGILPGTM